MGKTKLKKDEGDIVTSVQSEYAHLIDSSGLDGWMEKEL
jgi:hypothetical protein